MEAVIQESSPLSLKTLSLGSSCTSSTGMTVPCTLACMVENLLGCRQFTCLARWEELSWLESSLWNTPGLWPRFRDRNRLYWRGKGMQEKERMNDWKRLQVRA
jgi:hypothetical protein